MRFNFDLFIPGQRVKYISKDRSGIEYGEKGTVVPYPYDPYYAEAGRVAVDWDKEGAKRHNCAGNARNNHGWCVSERDIEITL